MLRTFRCDARVSVSPSVGLLALLIAACSSQGTPRASGGAGKVGQAANGGAMNGAGGQFANGGAPGTAGSVAGRANTGGVGVGGSGGGASAGRGAAGAGAAQAGAPGGAGGRVTTAGA